MDHKLWEILVPCQFNDEKPVSTRHHREWDRKVRAISGGLTVLKPGKGFWVKDGTVYADRTIPVRIRCTRQDMDKIVQITLLHYEQLAVMYYVLSDECYIVEASDALKARFIRKNVHTVQT